VPFLFPRTIQDSLSFYLRAEEQAVQSDSLLFNFENFEYLSVNSQGILFAPDSTEYEKFLPVPGNEGLLFSFSPTVSGILFLIFLLCLVTFSIIFRKEGAALSGNFRSIFSSGIRSAKGFKEQVTTTEVWGEFFLIFQAILLYTIFLVVFLWENEPGLSLKSYASNFVGIFLALTLLIVLKYLMYRLIGGFFLQNDLKSWTSRYFRLIELSGVLLFIPLFIYVFLPESRSVLIFVVLIIFITVRLIIVAWLINIFVKNKVGGFYFFVYLCGTEIAPYLLYYKGLLSLISIAGNNIV